MTQAGELITRVAKALQDPEYTRWTMKEMLEWLSEAQIAVARTPGAYPVVKHAPLKKGTRQILPEDAWSLLTITRNFDEEGTPLYPVRIVPRVLLDACEPDWHRQAETPIVENYIYDDRTPKEVYVYPPNDGTGIVELIYCGIPAPIESMETELVVDDTYIPPLVDYLLYRANAKETDYASGVQSAAAFFSAYQQELSAAVTARGVITPNAALAGGSVNSNGSTE